MENFTPGPSFLGGVLIGLGVAILLIFNGRIAGVSGILNGLFTSKIAEWAWRFAFLAGLVAGASITQYFSATPLAPRLGFPFWMLAAGGFLVGVGTRMANGCTSGHGVCGIARFSVRSIIATLVFISFAGLTVFLVRHVFGGS